MIPGAKSALNIENCSCPVEYKGQFCEQCANGYTRVTPKGGPYVTCVPCECNGHSDKCDTETGVCLDCQHNTTGISHENQRSEKNFLEGRNWINKIGGVRKYF